MTDIERLTATARRLYADRRERDRRLGGYVSLMGEPAWDMLLHLLVEHGECASLAEQDHVGETAAMLPALHWAAILHKLGLVERRPRTSEEGRVFRLSGAGLALMTRVVADQ